jgi:hypothetical protein
MSHFQLPDGTRLWVDEFKDERIAIHLGVEIELEQWGSTDAFGKTPKLHLNKEGVVELRLIERPSSDKPFTISKRRFGLKAVGEGTAILTGKDEDGKTITDPLKVTAGAFKTFEGMEKDLLAEVGRSSNGQLIHELQLLLHNNRNSMFNQLNDANVAKYKTPLACGLVAKAGGDAVIGKVVSHSFEKDSSYHKPIRKVTSRDDIEYDPKVMRQAMRAIARHVRSGHPVLVGCAYDPKTSMLKDGHLQATRDGGHSVLIVGCNKAGDEFLYVDPWRGGSNLPYKGGIKAEAYPRECHQLGLFKVDDWEETLGRGPVLRKHKEPPGPAWGGDRYLEVISGPRF